MSSEDQGLKPIREVVDDVLARLVGSGASTLTTLVEEWNETAGEPWAGRSRPASMANGVLGVEVASGVAASILKHDIGRLMQRLKARCGEGAITEIRLRVARPERPVRPGGEAAGGQ